MHPAKNKSLLQLFTTAFLIAGKTEGIKKLLKPGTRPHLPFGIVEGAILRPPSTLEEGQLGKHARKSILVHFEDGEMGP